MATSFKAADSLATTSRTLVYTCPASTQAVVFSGTLANIDTTNKQEQSVIVEIQKVDTTYILVLNNVPVPYGNSLLIPKIALIAGESIYVTCSSGVNLIEARLSIVEKV